MEEKDAQKPVEKKAGRPKGSKNRPKGFYSHNNRKDKKGMTVIAINKDTFEFIGIFPSSNQAGRVLFNNPDMGNAIIKCARGEYKKVHQYTFGFIDVDKGITTDLIKEAIEELKKRTSMYDTIEFATPLLKKMEPEELETLKRLYDKYSK